MITTGQGKEIETWISSDNVEKEFFFEKGYKRIYEVDYVYMKFKLAIYLAVNERRKFSLRFW